MSLSLAVIGAGYWGPNWIRVISEHPDIDLRAVCDLSPSRRRYIKERYPEINVIGDINKVLRDGDVDAAILVTPLSTHEDLGLRLLQAGKHVLIEKPLAATFEGAQILVDAAEHSGLVLAVGHVFAYHPAVKAMVREISNGTIGEILYTQSQRMNLGPPDPRVDVVWDLAVHDLSIMLAITEQEPVTVQAIGGQFTHANLTDVAFITTRFTNGRLAAHQVGWHASVKVRDFYVAGDAGSMRFDDTLDKDKLKIYDLGIDNRVGPNADQTVDLTYGAGQIRGIFLDEVEPLKQQCEEFVRAISGGPPPTADGRAGLAVVKMLEAATQSIKSNGRLVTLANGDSQKREEG